MSKGYAVGGDIAGDVTSTTGAISMVYASGGDVSGLLRIFYVRGDFYNSTIEAGSLSRVLRGRHHLRRRQRRRHG